MDRASIESILKNKKKWTKKDELVIQTPYIYLAKQPGKNFRSKLIHIFNAFYNVPENYVSMVCKIIDILHNASLMIDDIEDNSPMRRGIKASHMIYGIPMTINSANYMYFKALECTRHLATYGMLDFRESVYMGMQAELLTIFEEELKNLHRGQALELHWRDSHVTPSVEMYFEMATNKTGGLFRLACRLLEEVAERYDNNKTLTDEDSMNFENSLIPLCNLLGVVYQIRDDYLNLVDDKMTSDKGFAEDISEGKMSFPIIHALAAEAKQMQDDSSKTPFLKNTLRAKTDDIKEKKKFVDILKDDTHSLEYTKETLVNLASLIHDGNYFPIPREDREFDDDALGQLKDIVDHLSTV